MPARTDLDRPNAAGAAPIKVRGSYGGKRHCYICKQIEGADEKRKDLKASDPIVVIYPSTPRCKPCQRLMARKSYHKRKDKINEARARARAALKMPPADDTKEDQDADAAADA